MRITPANRKSKGKVEVTHTFPWFHFSLSLHFQNSFFFLYEVGWVSCMDQQKCSLSIPQSPYYHLSIWQKSLVRVSVKCVWVRFGLRDYNSQTDYNRWVGEICVEIDRESNSMIFFFFLVTLNEINNQDQAWGQCQCVNRWCLKQA